MPVQDCILGILGESPVADIAIALFAEPAVLAHGVGTAEAAVSGLIFSAVSTLKCQCGKIQ